MKFLQLAMSRSIVKRSLVISLVVGTILNIVNQGDVMMSDEKVDILKCILTYLVPYCVSSYAAISALLAADKDA